MSKSLFFRSYLIKIFIIFYIFFISTFLFSEKKNQFISQKLIFLYPERSSKIIIENQIIAETIAAIDELDKNIDIVFLKERKWVKHKELISDLSNHEKIGEFFLKTEVTGMISVSLEDKYEKYIVNIIFYDIRNNLMDYETYIIFKSTILNDIDEYKEYVKKIIKKQFPKININNIKKAKIKSRISARKNPRYEFLLGGGVSYYSRQSMGGDIISNGVSTNIRLGAKWFNFALDYTAEFTPLFNDPEELKELDNSFFLYNFYTSLDTGVWLANQSFKLGLGMGFMSGQFYVEYREYNEKDKSDYYYYQKENVLLVFSYLNLTFLPIRTVSIFFDLGGFFSPSSISKIHASFFFPLYMKIGFRYTIYKNFYIEIFLPYYMLERERDSENDGGGSPIFQGQFTVGFGWKWEWIKE